jgi:hypothetical protein
MSAAERKRQKAAQTPNSPATAIFRAPSGWRFVRGRIHIGGGMDASDVPGFRPSPGELALAWADLQNSVVSGEFVKIASGQRLMLIIEVSRQQSALLEAFSCPGNGELWKTCAVPTCFHDFIAKVRDVAWL